MTQNLDQNLRARTVGPRRLDIGGYLYIKSFDRNGSTYWDCHKVREKVCKARAITSNADENGLIVVKGPEQSPHSHPPNREFVEAERIKCAIKQKADADSRTNPSIIVRGNMNIIS